MNTPTNSEAREQAIRFIKTITAKDAKEPLAYVEELEALINKQIKEARIDNELSRFKYVDWETGEDDVLRIGDYINCNHQRPYDGYGQNFEGQIVEHHANKMPVIICNVDPNDPKDSGDYVAIQNLFIEGWEFSRLTQLRTTKCKPILRRG